MSSIFIDTADVYGPHTNELLIREALYPLPLRPGDRHQRRFVRGGYDYSTLGAVGNPNYLRQSAHLSARRLGVDAAVTAHYNVAVRTGADLLRAAEDAGMAFSPWHAVTLTEGPDSTGVMAVVEPIASRHGVTPRQVALAWHLHRSPASLPIPGTTSVGHLKDNLAAGKIELSSDDTAVITALVAEQ